MAVVAELQDMPKNRKLAPSKAPYHNENGSLASSDKACGCEQQARYNTGREVEAVKACQIERMMNGRDEWTGGCRFQEGRGGGGGGGGGATPNGAAEN